MQSYVRWEYFLRLTILTFSEDHETDSDSCLSCKSLLEGDYRARYLEKKKWTDKASLSKSIISYHTIPEHSKEFKNTSIYEASYNSHISKTYLNQ